MPKTAANAAFLFSAQPEIIVVLKKASSSFLSELTAPSNHFGYKILSSALNDASCRSIQKNWRHTMADDLRDFAQFPGRWERPSTSRGSWSLKLLAGFFALMVVFFAMMSSYGGPQGARRLAEKTGGGFFSVPLLAVPLIAALVSATAAFVAAYSAITGKGERSILMLLPLIIGGLAVLFAVGAIVGST